MLGGGDKTAPPTEQPSHMQHYQSERTSIVRQTCIKAAVETVKAIDIPDMPVETTNYNDFAIKEVLRRAAAFEQWINRTE